MVKMENENVLYIYRNDWFYSCHHSTKADVLGWSGITRDAGTRNGLVRFINTVENYSTGKFEATIKNELPPNYETLVGSNTAIGYVTNARPLDADEMVLLHGMMALPIGKH